MTLYIDNTPCEVVEGQTIELGLSEASLRDPLRELPEVVLWVHGPAAFNHAEFPYAVPFNETPHEGRLEVEGMEILRGPARLLSAVDGRYRIGLRREQGAWARKLTRERFSTLPVAWSQHLLPADFAAAWDSRPPVAFLPVARDSYEREISSVELGSVKKPRSTDDFYPFIHVLSALEQSMTQTGYALRGGLLSDAFCQSLYMSGAYARRNTEAMRTSMDFFAHRTLTSSMSANSYGRVYTYYSGANSVGPVVGAATFTNNNCLRFENGRPIFTPRTSVTVGFEFELHYATHHRILSRERLAGLDTIYLGNSSEIHVELQNTYVDRRPEGLRKGYSYRVYPFNHTPGNKYIIAVDGQALQEFTEPGAAAVCTVAGEPYMIYLPTWGGPWLYYPDDWAVYDGHIEAVGRSEVRLKGRSKSEHISAGASKQFETLFFSGGWPGCELTLYDDCSLRPDFTGLPAAGTFLSFADVAHHTFSRWKLVEALTHMLNLRFWADERTKQVWIDTADNFYRLGKRVDWSDRTDGSEPVSIEDLAARTERVRKYRYRSDDGTVTRWETENGRNYGDWDAICPSAAAIDEEKEEVNPLFSATISEPGMFPAAPSAAVMLVGDRDVDSEKVSPRIVQYNGLVELPAGESCGYPMPAGKYPLASFRAVSFEDRCQQFYRTEAEQARRCQRITIYLRIEPWEIASLQHIQAEAPSIASIFTLNVNGQRVEAVLERIDTYDPTAPSTRCVFKRLPTN